MVDGIFHAGKCGNHYDNGDASSRFASCQRVSSIESLPTGIVRPSAGQKFLAHSFNGFHSGPHLHMVVVTIQLRKANAFDIANLCW